LNYLSVCSGIEAATVAWQDLGWKPAGFSEIEKFPSQVLAHHYPDVTNFGDMTKYKEWNINDPIGLLVGGTPCQSFSVAGLRKGLDDPRGNLALTYVGILDKFRPKWCVWENVPGVLSSGGGRDFGSFLGALGEIGYGWAYRVLDAQYFGVAQRRKRVFVIGYLGDWKPAAEILFESESLSGNTQKGRKKEQDPAAFTASSFGSYSEGVGTIRAAGGDLGGGSETLYVPDLANCLQTTCDDYSRADGFNMVAYENHSIDSRIKKVHISPSIRAAWGTGGGNVPLVQNVAVGAFGKNISDTVTAKFAKGAELLQQGAQNGGNCVLQPIPIHDQATRFSGNNNGKGNGLGIGKPGDPMPTLDTSSRHAVAFGWQNSSHQGMSVDAISPTLDKSKTPAVFCDTYNGTIQEGVSATMTADMAGPTHSGPKVMQNMAVRRLTPVECERLQGFPDNYTNIPKAADGNRYKALGNSMAVPVMRWIGERINQHEQRGMEKHLRG
jgi:DNA (cytosine-5)-methyltransferase 1